MSLDHLYIETERLIIRPFEDRDVQPSYEMNLDPEVSRYTGDGGVVPYEEIVRRLTEDVHGDYKKYGYGRLAVELKSDGSFIGFTGLKYLDDLDLVDLGYRFMRKYWGNGYATESCRACLDLGFGHLKLEQIVAMVIPENIGSIKVLEKLDFQYEKEMYDEGQLVWLYSLTK